MWDFMYICELLMAIPGKATNNNGIVLPDVSMPFRPCLYRKYVSP